MARMKKTIILPQVRIDGLADKGRGVGTAPDGRVVFVPEVAPGDVVDVLVKKKKSGFYEGIPQHIHTFSPHRETPFCSHFQYCGGCKYQHIQYKEQIRQKERTVRDALHRIGKVEVGEFLPILGAEETRYYRNKLEFSFSNKKWLTPEQLNTGVSNREDVLGFHRAGAFDKIINISECFLQPEPSNNLRNTLRKIGKDQGLSFYDARTHKGFLRNVVLRITTLGQSMMIMAFGSHDEPAMQSFFEEVMHEFPNLTSIYSCVNTKVNDFLGDLPMDHVHGSEWVEEQLGSVRFRIGPKSFFQTNTRQAERLYGRIAEFAELTGNENVYDLYTGLGSIALFLANSCRQVVGIEEIERAIDDARVNAQINQINNAVFYAGDVRDILSADFAHRHGAPDLIVTDPPRAGMHPDVIQLLAELNAPKIVYVSCNPATQARDLSMLSEQYRVEKVQPVDMFPHTHHIETVALLIRRGNIPAEGNSHSND
jgi:23S rRNA (uracil1939-C5)-methyltransferase